ncbi:radical SAM (seleno)protein TrsS [Paludibacterium yongneupense]|uniref:radical SAM (seleno)protein TrsS n=1 Tax=Paludibacterium yongneupense TaxID=400061 RepID=UPI00041C4896|nr:radical SAM (seleno)protein TrsS [Paludibacterium yongneupense]
MRAATEHSALRTAAIVLAAGYSSRMGCFKPLLPLGDRSVIAGVIDTLHQAGIRDVIVVTGHRGECMVPELAGLGVRRVHNRDYANGMYSSVAAGFAALPDTVDACLVHPVDIPQVRAASIRRLLRHAGQTDSLIVYPCFHGERGHPPLIRRALFADIIAGKGDGGLKHLLESFEPKAENVDVFDAGILRDMDTPADYIRLLAFASARGLPSQEECEAILAAYRVDERVCRHSRKVADVAVALAQALIDNGVEIDLARVKAGALLHDIARAQPDHAMAGAAMMPELGFPSLAPVVASHMDLDFAGGEPDAGDIVFLADKLVREDRLVTLPERFRPAFERFHGHEDALRGVRRRYAAARAIAGAVERASRTGLDTLLAGPGTESTQPPRLFSETDSVCPVCLERLPAQRVGRGDSVYLEKTCPQHGSFSTVIWRGLPSYPAWGAVPHPAAPPHKPQAANTRGCPYDCGLCPEHAQHTCCVLLEVTRRCNLRCPVCFAAADTRGDDPSLDEIERRLRELRAAAGQVNLQLSGGEPTLRDDLPEIVAVARESGFDFVQLNSNGIRLARDDTYVHRLARAGLDCVFLQFDGLDDAIYRRLRGADLFALKQAAIENCARHGIGVVLVPTLVPGVNVAAIGSIIDFAARLTPAVRAVHFQPVSYFGRYPTAPLDADRLTLPELMREIELQSGGRIAVADFHPGSAENAYCSFSGNFTVDADYRLQALPPTQDDGCGCGSTSDRAQRARRAVAAQWAAPPALAPDGCCGGGISTVSFDAFLARRRRRLSISAMAFQDAWTLDLERLRDCYIHVATEDTRIVPFCAYNLTAQSGHGLYRRRALAEHGEQGIAQ